MEEVESEVASDAKSIPLRAKLAIMGRSALNRKGTVGAFVFLLFITMTMFRSRSSSPTSKRFLRSFFFGNTQSSSTTTTTSAATSVASTTNQRSVPRILYIITSSQEYNDGGRATQEGQDRLMEMVVPVILDGVESLLEDDYHVDVYLILGYTLKPERQALVQERLPAGVGLEVWNDACPISYDWPVKSNDKLMEIDRALARQHRFVIKDKFPYYEFFMAFEDDMLVKSSHVRYYLAMSAELEALRAKAPEEIERNGAAPTYYEPLTKKQLARMRPGFIRVEVLLDEQKHPVQERLDPVPLDYMIPKNQDGNYEGHVDPEPCCHVRHIGLNGTLAPPTPRPDQLMVWETGIRGIRIRKMPAPFKWMGFLSGPSGSHKLTAFWPGSHGVMSDSQQADEYDPNYLAQSAGWMATRPQMMELHQTLCDGGFLPPWDAPEFPHDGLKSHNVEFWSGGIQMWCVKCNVQRIIPLKPELFSRSLLYHTANNKQKVIKQHRLVKVDHLLGQLNFGRKAAAFWKQNATRALS